MDTMKIWIPLRRNWDVSVDSVAGLKPRVYARVSLYHIWVMYQYSGSGISRLYRGRCCNSLKQRDFLQENCCLTANIYSREYSSKSGAFSTSGWLGRSSSVLISWWFDTWLFQSACLEQHTEVEPDVFIRLWMLDSKQAFRHRKKALVRMFV